MHVFQPYGPSAIGLMSGQCTECGGFEHNRDHYTNPPSTKEEDPVNRPSHYTSHPSGIECIEITRWENFNIGNVFKYLWRSGEKEFVDEIQDLKKAQWYLNDEIKRLEKLSNKSEHELEHAKSKKE